LARRCRRRCAVRQGSPAALVGRTADIFSLRIGAAVKLLVTGAGGQVGRELSRFAWPPGCMVAAFNHGELDIADCDAVVATVKRERPDIVINAAAYTAVDRAENEREAAWAGNCTGPANIAATCRDGGIPL